MKKYTLSDMDRNGHVYWALVRAFMELSDEDQEVVILRP